MAPVPYLLDTTIAIITVRNGKLAQYVEANYHLRTSPLRPLISAVSIGELYAMALKNNWNVQKKEAIALIERELVVVDIYHPDIIQAYAEIDAATEPKGKTLSKNDLWIAATAKATKSTLLTTDKDFNPLSPDHINLVWVDPIHGK